MGKPANSQELPFRYWAFISYSHTDEATASRIHRALESYRLPRRLVNRKTDVGSVPRRLFPIFRDLDELPSSSDLGEKLRESLRESRTLIVICSPQAAQSTWVNEEIREFLSLGRRDHVFCIIAGGDPGATDTGSRIFPEALEGEPLAVDFRKGVESSRDAKLRLIAGMVGLGLDELKRRDRQRRMRTAAVVTIAAVGMLAGITSLWLYGQNQQEVADSRTLAAASIRATDEDENPVVGLELAIQAYEKSPTDEARAALALALEYQRTLLILQHDAAVRHASFSSDGGRILTCGAGSAVRIWSTESGDVLQQISETSADVRSCRFSADASLVVTLNGSNDIHVWSSATGELRPVLRGHTGRVNWLDFSADGDLLLTASSDGTIRTWDVTTSELLAVIDIGQIELRAAYWMTDESSVLVVADNGIASIWDVDSRTILQEFGSLIPGVHDAVVSGDKTRLLLANYQYGPSLWELSNPVRRIEGAMAVPHVAGAAFSTDSSTLALGGGDGFVSVFNATEGYKIKRLQHPDMVSSLAFAADDQLIVTAADKIRIWSTPVLGGGVANSSEPLRGHVGWIRIADIAPDNDLHVLTIGDDDQSVRLWDISVFGQRKKSLSLAELTGPELLALAEDRMVTHGYSQPQSNHGDSSLK